MDLQCKMCGSELLADEDAKVVICDFCGTEQTVPLADDTHKINLFNEANDCRRNNRFDEAKGIYQHIVQEYPEESEARWCLLLCEYGIEYVDDAKTGKKVPTCHRTMRTSIFDHPEYQKIMSIATSDTRELYEKEASEIDRIQKDILKISAKEEPYDIFICYKETREDKKRTKDSQYASKIYTKLAEGSGYKVFFSRVTLKSKIGSEYEPIIFSALQSAKVMLVIGSCEEYMNAPWVRNEWSRYLSFMEDDIDKTIVPCIIDMDPYDIPEDLQAFQAQDMSDLDFIENLTRAINSKFGRSNSTPRPTSYVEESPVKTVDKSKLINRIKLKLLDDSYDEANALIGEALEDDFECKELWELKIKALLKGEKTPNAGAKKAFKTLLSLCEGAEDEKKYKNMFPYLLDGEKTGGSRGVTQTVTEDPFAAFRRQGTQATTVTPPTTKKDTTKVNGTGVANEFDELFASKFKTTQPPRDSMATAEAQFKSGEKYYENKEYFRAIECFKKASQVDHEKAITRLGDCYYYGNGTVQDYNEAFKMYKRAAELGYGEAQNKLAMCYDDGLGTQKDAKNAFIWYKMAAGGGHMYAQRNLSECYKVGKGTSVNKTEALKWLQAAAAQGDMYAQNSLGYCYEVGTLTAENLVEAFNWYKKAAEQGLKDAQCNLAIMYYYGKTPERQQDCEQAAYWYTLAASQGHTVSQYNLSSLYKSGRLKTGKDINLAIKWLKKSAMHGYAIAQYKLGMAFERGDGVERDLDTAYYWYRKASIQNNKDAKLALERLK